jgi:phosphatidylserine decarboxylase
MTILPVLVLTGLALSAAAWGAFRFTLRDPERTPPVEDHIIVAPADGRIKYIKRIERGIIPYSEKNGRHIPILESTKIMPVEEGYLIGVWMSFLVVHVQRVPVSGVVEKQHYHASGKFLDPHLQEGADYQNERNIIAIKSSDLPAPVIVIQIASIMVRRIISYVKEQMPVRIGDRLGLIRMGSQVDIVIPTVETLRLCVSVGDRVTAGETVIARYSPRTSQPQ